MPSRPSLSIVIPLYREAGNVAPLVARVHEALAAYAGCWELICVDDGSTDTTWTELREQQARYGAHVHLLRLPRNRGQTAAMQAGIDAARGELIATLDGDLQNDPADLPRMVDELLARDLDLLAGRRQDRRDHWLSRKLPSRLANHLIRRVTGVQLSDYGCTLKLFRAEVIKQVRLFGEMHRFIPVWVAGVTSPERIGETRVSHHPRRLGQSKYGLSRTGGVLLDLVTAFFFLRFQARPGHFFGTIGLAVGTLGGGILAYLAAVKFALGEDIGGRPLFFVGILLLMFAGQFITTGVLAEMLTRLLYRAHPQPERGLPPRAADEGWMHSPQVQHAAHA